MRIEDKNRDIEILKNGLKRKDCEMSRIKPNNEKSEKEEKEQINEFSQILNELYEEIIKFVKDLQTKHRNFKKTP